MATLYSLPLSLLIISSLFITHSIAEDISNIDQLTPIKKHQNSNEQKIVRNVIATIFAPNSGNLIGRTHTDLISSDKSLDISTASSCPLSIYTPKRSNRGDVEKSLAFTNNRKTKEKGEIVSQDDEKSQPLQFPSDLTAKILYTATGATLLGVAGYRYFKYYLKNKEIERFTRPATAFTNMFGHILLRNNSTDNKIVKVATGDVIDNNTVVAVLFTGKGIEDIIKQNGFVSFLPKLKNVYENCKSKGQKLEIVYVSLDRNNRDSINHFMDMPWYSLPFDNWDNKKQLIQQFQLTKLPAIVLLNSDGSVLNGKAYNAMISSPNNYPWKPQSIKDLIHRGLINNKNSTIDLASLKGKTIGLYFSANWCPPCQKFTPKLVELYKIMSEQQKPFEIIFISNDENEQKFFEYFKEMPWLAIPYSDISSRALLQDELEVPSLPTLIIFDENFEIVNKNGRRAIELDPTGNKFPWVPKCVKDISESVEGLIEHPSLILFMEEADTHKQEEMNESFLKVAETFKTTQTNSPLEFFVVSKSNPQSVGLRRLFKLPMCVQPAEAKTGNSKPKMHMVILDLQQKCYYKQIVTNSDNKNFVEFISNYYKGNLNSLKEIIDTTIKESNRN